MATLDEKLEWTFKFEATWYGVRPRRSNSTRSDEKFEFFQDNLNTGNIERHLSNISFFVRCPSWKQALLYTFYYSPGLLKIQVKDECFIFGKGYIMDLNGTVLLSSMENIVDRKLLTDATSKGLGETFIKHILPIMVASKKEITIKDSSSFKQLAVKPKIIGKKLNEDLLQCAKNSLALLVL